MKRFLPTLWLAGLLVLQTLMAVPAFAFGGLALTTKVSTLGVGIEATTGITETLNARLGVNAFSYTYSGSQSDIDYDLDLTLQSETLLLDWHPFAGAFRLSAGVVGNQNALDMESTPELTQVYKVGNVYYPAAAVGRLVGSIDLAPVAPYAGIGLGNALGNKGRWHVGFDLGVVFQGSPEVELSAQGPIALVPQFQQELLREVDDIEDEIDKYRYYPVVSLGVSYRF